jgi:hypothetical protein
VKADGGNVVEGFSLRAAVEGFNVAEGVGEAVAGHADLVGGEAVKHECVVGVGAVGNGDFANARGGDGVCRLR